MLNRNLSFKRIFGLSLLACSAAASAASERMYTLNDEELADVKGQALFNLSYLAPNQAGNNEPGTNIGFYKLGIEAEVELNANINKLQLGCGGINGPGECDIDIDKLSLSGGDGSTREGRAGSSAKMTNPFVEIAIRNPNIASTREIVGLRVSAEKVKGLLTMGTENSDVPNGLNTLSGYMNIKSASGVATTQSRNMTYNDTGMTINGNVKTSFLFIPLTLGFQSNDYNLVLAEATAPFTTKPLELYGNRLKKATLEGEANINQINFAGRLKASLNITAGLLRLEKQVTGNITGLKADLTVDEALGFIHKINLDNPFSLSLQKQKIFWPGAAVAAERGWWMAFEDPIDIGSVTPANKIQITNEVLKQVVNPISSYIQANPPSCSLLNCLLGADLAVGNVNLNGTRVDFPLANLKLAAQSFQPNCWGTLTFC